jgi:hypothetical protein
MDPLAWERQLMRHKEMLRKAESMQVRQMVLEVKRHEQRLRLLRLFHTLTTWLHNHRLRRYNQPLEPRPPSRTTTIIDLGQS